MSKFLFNPLSGTFDLVYNKAEEIEFVPAVPAQWSGTITNTEEALNTIKSDIADAQELVKEPTGFVTRTTTTLSFSDIDREFTISPVGASFDVYVKGVKYTKTAESVTLSNDDGNHYIYYNLAGVLTSTVVFDPSIFENNALVSIVYWNSVTELHAYFADERHGLVMDGATHAYLHTVFGARYLSGLALQDFRADGDGSLDADAEFGADSGKIRDEDILIDLPPTSEIPVLFRDGFLWRKKTADAFPVIYNGTAGYTGTRLAYNELVGVLWQLSEVNENDFVLTHIFATNDIETPFVAILGIDQYPNIPSARAAAESEISSLSGLPFAEFVAIGTVIFQTSSSFTNTPKAMVRSAASGELYVDFRGEQLYTPSGVATSHSLLSNLSSDDHPQYVKKIGDTLTGSLLITEAGPISCGLSTDGIIIGDTTSPSNPAYYNRTGFAVKSELNPAFSSTLISSSSSFEMNYTDNVSLSYDVTNITPYGIRLYYSPDGITESPRLATYPEDVTTKAYVDQTLGDYVLKVGDTMTGNLNIEANVNVEVMDDSISITPADITLANSTSSMSAVINRTVATYTDIIGTTTTEGMLGAGALSLMSSDSLSGDITSTQASPGSIFLQVPDGLGGSVAPLPTVPGQLTTKRYVDEAIASAGGASTFNAVSVNGAVVPSYDFTAPLPKGAVSFAPIGICTSASWSPDGKMLAISTSGGNYYNFYDRAGIYFSGLPSSVSIAPAGPAYGTAWSSDGRFLATAHATTPFVTILQRTANPIAISSFTKLSNPSILPAGNGTGVAWSPDGAFLSVSHVTTPFITIYQRSETTFTKLTNPVSLPTGNANGAAWSPDGRFLLVAHATTPFITIYERSGTTFTKLADPAILPTGIARNAAWSSDGKLLVVSHDTSPFITIYEQSGTTFTKLTNPTTLPTGNAYGVAWSSDNKMLAVGHATAPFITIYERSGTTFTKIPDSTTAMTGPGVAVAFSPNNRFLVSSHTAGTTFPIWETSSAAPDIIDKVPKILGKLGE